MFAHKCKVSSRKAELVQKALVKKKVGEKPGLQAKTHTMQSDREALP